MDIFTDSKQSNEKMKCKIILISDETNIIDALSIYSNVLNYNLLVFNDPVDAINQIKVEHFDLLILNFSMYSSNDINVIENIRAVDKEISILLLIDDNCYAPSLDLIRKFNIYGFFEKKSPFGQLLLLIDSAIKNINLICLIKNYNIELSKFRIELEKSYFETIQTLRYAVEAKDPYTKGHSDRVSAYSVLLGEFLDMDKNSLDLLRIGGLFHDIGKIAVPDKILLKSHKLTSSEYSQIKKHPSIGAHILSRYTLFKGIIPIVACHHERYDGSRLSF